MTLSLKKLSLFFKDKHGKWAVIQFPNVLLSIWITLVIIGFFIHDARLGTHIDMLKNAVLFAWAYLELTSGLSYFRKVLGGAVLLSVVVNFLK